MTESKRPGSGREGGNKEGGGNSRGGRGRRGRNNRGKRSGNGQGGGGQGNPKAKQPHAQSTPSAGDGAIKKKGKSRRRRRGKKGNQSAPPKKPMGKIIENVPTISHGVLFFDSHAQAKNNLEKIKEKAAEVGVLNVVIKAEGTMNDPDITAYARMFAGEAWYLIHTRRQEDGWYDVPQPTPSGVQPAALASGANEKAAETEPGPSKQLEETQGPL